jgi:hypothetical protein
MKTRKAPSRDIYVRRDSEVRETWDQEILHDFYIISKKVRELDKID